MPQINYTVNLVGPIGFEKISDTDSSVVESFSLNSLFNLQDNKIELHIYSLDGGLLQSINNYSDTTNLSINPSAGKQGTSEIQLDPKKDVENLGYGTGGVITVYNFVNDLFGSKRTPATFYIKDISTDRTELRLISEKLDRETLSRQIDIITNKLKSNSYYNDFKLNFGNNKFLIGVNIKLDTFQDTDSVLIKLYEALPQDINEKEILTIEETVSDSVAYSVESEIIPDVERTPYLKGANFNIDLSNNNPSSPTEYFNYDELFGFSNINDYRQLKSTFAEKSADISIDYSTFDDFVHFGSAEERLTSFKYKLDQITSYQNSIDDIENGTSVEPGISGSREYYKGLIDGIVDNFDHYDRFLFYESSSYSWPKQEPLEVPYIIATGSATGSWYSTQLTSASNFDDTNVNQLIDSVPRYIIDDSANAPYRLFINMMGQYFDNLWVYTKAVTDKYNADNRLDKGVSKDLVENTLKNFGVKLYTGTRSTEDLFKMYTGQLFDTGSENINTLISASSTPTKEDSYRKEVYKRIYHNLPLLLKSKGTEKGIRVLVNSFGIPTINSIQSGSALTVKTGGGSNTLGNVNLGNLTISTSSFAKIRLDDTGSQVNNTLSLYTSINSRDGKYTDDTTNIEIGYSPTDKINEKIIEYLNGL